MHDDKKTKGGTRGKTKVLGARSARRKSEVTFKFEPQDGARRVFVAGDFNDWDPEAMRMSRRGGVFRKTVTLTPGEHQYKFVVDGEWRTDPSAERQIPNAIGSTNSVITV